MANRDDISITSSALARDAFQEWEDDTANLKSLSKKVEHLHTSFLYYRNYDSENSECSEIGDICLELWRRLLKSFGGIYNGWRDLGLKLHIDNRDLDYIGNSDKDKVDMVLRVFKQNLNASLDKVINAIIKMGLYSILKDVEEPLLKLSNCFPNTSSNDSGYDSGTRQICYPENITNDQPPAILKTTHLKPSDIDEEINQMRELMSGLPSDQNAKYLFLTFTQDGINTAVEIHDYVKKLTNFDVKVITLSGKRDELLDCNRPERYIKNYFEKACFVVPIITPGYLEIISSKPSNQPNTNPDLLDHKYVNYIYNMIVNHYIAAGCYNKKVRSVLPKDSNNDVIQEVLKIPELCPWTAEYDFVEQFHEFLQVEEELFKKC